MGRNKYIITKIKCWPVFKQDPSFLLIKCIIFESVSKILFIFFIVNNNYYDSNIENIAP